MAVTADDNSHRAHKGPAETHSHCDSYSQTGRVESVQSSESESVMMAMAMWGGKERNIQLVIKTMLKEVLVSRFKLITPILSRATKINIRYRGVHQDGESVERKWPLSKV